MENRNKLTKKSSNTCVSAETSNKTIGLNYFPLSNLSTTHVHTAVLERPHSRFGMDITQPLNHHSISKLETRLRTSGYNTWNKFKKRLLYRCSLQQMNCAKRNQHYMHIIFDKGNNYY